MGANEREKPEIQQSLECVVGVTFPNVPQIQLILKKCKYLSISENRNMIRCLQYKLKRINQKILPCTETKCV